MAHALIDQALELMDAQHFLKKLYTFRVDPLTVIHHIGTLGIWPVSPAVI